MRIISEEEEKQLLRRIESLERDCKASKEQERRLEAEVETVTRSASRAKEAASAAEERASVAEAELREANQRIEHLELKTPASSMIATLVRVVGVGLVAVSIVLIVIMVRGVEVRMPREVIWSLYLAAQFAGIYLLGYGNALTLASWTWAGLYMTTVFLILSIVILLILTVHLVLPISTEIVALAALNATGVVVLIQVERRLLKLRKQQSELSQELSGAKQ